MFSLVHTTNRNDQSISNYSGTNRRQKLRNLIENRRRFIAASMGLLLSKGALSDDSRALGFKVATLVTGFTVGGSSDVLCRKVAPKLTPAFAETVVVDNRTGASGQIAVNFVKGKVPDGTTILQSALGVLTIYPHIYNNISYDVMRDFVPAGLAGRVSYGFAVGPAVPENIKTITDYLSYASKNPSAATLSSPAMGSVPHFIGALLAKQSGVNLIHVAYRGGQPALQDLVGGNVAAFIGPLGDINALLSTQKVRLLAVATEERTPLAPGIATFAEQGIQNMVHYEWLAFFFPAGTSRAIVNRFNFALGEALATPEVADGLKMFGFDVETKSPDGLMKMVKDDLEKWRGIVSEVGFQIDA